MSENPAAERHARFTVPTTLRGVADSSSRSCGLRWMEITPIYAGPEVAKPGVIAAVTNSYVAAFVRCSGNADTRYLVPPEFVPRTKKDTGLTIELSGEWRRADGMTVPYDDKPPRYPRLDDCLPVFDSGARMVTINAEYLAALSKSLNTENGEVTLIFPENPQTAIGVVGEHGCGVLMPVAKAFSDEKLRAYHAVKLGKYRELAAEYRNSDTIVRAAEAEKAKALAM